VERGGREDIENRWLLKGDGEGIRGQREMPALWGNRQKKKGSLRLRKKKGGKCQDFLLDRRKRKTKPPAARRKGGERHLEEEVSNKCIKRTKQTTT